MASPTLSGAIPPPPTATARPVAFNDPSTLWKWNVICQTLCLVIPGILFLLRVYVRVWIKAVWGLEDYMSCLSYIGLAIYSAIGTTIIYKHGGVHMWDDTEPEAIEALYYTNVSQIWYGPAAAIIKTAILLLYLRVFSSHKGSILSIIIRLCIAINTLFYIATTLVKIWQCSPRERAWNKKVEGTCVNVPALLYVSGIFNIVSDIIILLLPVKGLWNLQMDRRRKLGIYAVFTVGAIGPIFSILGFAMRFHLATSLDLTYNQPSIALWAAAELATGMMIICLPVLPALICRRRRRTHASNHYHIASTFSNRAGSNAYPCFAPSSTTSESDKRIGGKYVELVDRPSTHGGIAIPMPAVLNQVIGGDEKNFETCKNPPSEFGRAVGIVKTVTVEQSTA